VNVFASHSFDLKSLKNRGKNGGHDWDRTSDHCHVKAVLYR
jgi:hypothetical protein